MVLCFKFACSKQCRLWDQSLPKCDARDTSAVTLTATEQRTSGDVSNVPDKRPSRLYAKERLTIAVKLLGARTEPLRHTSIISALNACIDEPIEPLSPDKLRGIVTLNARAGAA